MCTVSLLLHIVCNNLNFVTPVLMLGFSLPAFSADIFIYEIKINNETK